MNILFTPYLIDLNKIDNGKQVIQQENSQITQLDDNNHMNNNIENKKQKLMEKICYQVSKQERKLVTEHTRFQPENEMLQVLYMDEIEKLYLKQDRNLLQKFLKYFSYVFIKISQFCDKIIKHKLFEALTLLLIMTNSVMLIFQDPQKEDSKQIQQIELVFLILYTIEMTLKIIGLGLIFNRGAYLRDSWNILDFIIVISAYIPYFMDSEGVNLQGLRSLRILRPLRTISSIKALKVILIAFFGSLPLLGDILLVLLFVYLIFAIGGLQLFMGLLKNRCMDMETGIQHQDDLFCGNSECPNNFECVKMIDNPNGGVTSFDNIAQSMLQVFQVTTLEGWTFIQDKIRSVFSDYAIIYFVLLIFLGNFFVMNMMLAVIKAKFSEEHEKANKIEAKEQKRKFKQQQQKQKIDDQEDENNSFSESDSSSDQDSYDSQSDSDSDNGQFDQRQFRFNLKQLQEYHQFFQKFKDFRSNRVKLQQRMDKGLDQLQYDRKLRRTSTLRRQSTILQFQQVQEKQQQNKQIIQQNNGSFLKNHSLTIQNFDQVNEFSKVDASKFGRYYSVQNQQYRSNQNTTMTKKIKNNNQQKNIEIQNKNRQNQKSKFSDYVNYQQINEENKEQEYDSPVNNKQDNNKSFSQQYNDISNLDYSDVKLNNNNNDRNREQQLELCDTNFQSKEVKQQQNNNKNSNIKYDKDGVNAISEYIENESIGITERKNQSFNNGDIQVFYNGKNKEDDQEENDKGSKNNKSIEIEQQKGSQFYQMPEDPTISSILDRNSGSLIVQRRRDNIKKNNNLSLDLTGLKQRRKGLVLQQQSTPKNNFQQQQTPMSNTNTNTNNSIKYFCYDSEIEQVQEVKNQIEKHIDNIPDLNSFNECRSMQLKDIHLQFFEQQQQNLQQEDLFQMFKKGALFKKLNKNKSLQLKQKVLQELQELEEQEQNSIQEKKNKILEQVQFQNLKIEVDFSQKYLSSSCEDVMEHRIREREQEQREEIIKNMLNQRYQQRYKMYQIQKEFYREERQKKLNILNYNKEYKLAQNKRGKFRKIQLVDQLWVRQQLNQIQVLQDQKQISPTKQQQAKILTSFIEKHEQNNQSQNKLIDGSHQILELSMVQASKSQIDNEKLQNNNNKVYPLQQQNQQKRVKEDEEKFQNDKQFQEYLKIVNDQYQDKEEQLIKERENNLYSIDNNQQQKQDISSLLLIRNDLKQQIVEKGFQVSRQQKLIEQFQEINEIIKDLNQQQKQMEQKNKKIKIQEIDEFSMNNSHIQENISDIATQVCYNEEEYLDQEENTQDKRQQIEQKIKRILQKTQKMEEQCQKLNEIKRLQVINEQERYVYENMSFEYAQKLVKQKVETKQDFNIKGNSKNSSQQDSNNGIEEAEKEIYKIYQKSLQDQEIRQKNWSGKNVLYVQEQDYPKFNKIIRALNYQEIDIWMVGFWGLVYTVRKYIRKFIRHPIFENFIILSVFINTVVLALDGLVTDKKGHEILDGMNLTFTIIFNVEMVLKLLGLGVKNYLRDPMNLFDGTIVIISDIELIFFSGQGSALGAFRSVRIFRTFRVLRVTKLLKSLAFMKVIIGVVSRTLQSFIYIALLLFLFIFIYALMGRQLYAGKLNIAGEPELRSNFDSFESSLLTAFQILTMENWQQIMYYAYRSDVNVVITTVYLISWIFIGNFSLLNLFLAILLDGFSNESAEKDLDDDEQDVSSSNVDGGDNNNKDQQQQNQNIKIEKKNKESMQNEIKVMLTDSNEVDLDDIEFQIRNEKQLNEEKKLQLKYKKLGCHKSIFLFSKDNYIRMNIYKLLQYKHFESIILVLIVFSSVKLALDTYLPLNENIDDIGDVNVKNLVQLSNHVDIILNCLFMLEAVLKIIAYGFIYGENSYIRDTWNQLDFFIVITSLFDMIFEGSDLQFLKVLRMLRTLRPLRFVSHNVNIKIVVVALVQSMSAILNVLIVLFLIYVMFGILGISLMGDKSGFCDIQNYYNINKEQCLQMGEEWKIRNTNFDHIGQALVTLFIISSLEGWPDINFNSVDGNYESEGPNKDETFAISLFYVGFIFIGSLFFMNLFVGAICFHFDKAHKNEKCIMHSLLTEDQNRWIQTQKLILSAKPDISKFFIPENKLRKRLYDLVNSTKFDLVILSCIMLNIFTMGLVYEGASDSYNLVLEVINYVFTSIFFLECIFKIIAMGFKGYFMNGWNKFDFFVVLSSIVDIVLGVVFSQNDDSNKGSILRIGPQLARIVRVLRVTRLLKLVKRFQGLQKVINTMILCLPSLLNVGALTLLVMFIFSVLGCYMFQDVKEGEVIDDYTNFWNFHNSLISLFRVSTGEDWFLIMFDLGKYGDGCVEGVDCGSRFSVIYFLSYIMITSFVMLNLFILIILNDFEEFNLKSNNPIEEFKENLEHFKQNWVEFTKEFKGEKISSKDIIPFLRNLNPPLGFGQNIDKLEIAQNVARMNFKGDYQGNVFFQELFFACLRRLYGESIAQQANKQIITYISIEEQNTKKMIEQQQLNSVKKRLGNNKFEQLVHKKQNNQNEVKLGQLYHLIFVRMSFLCLQNYAKKHQNRKSKKELLPNKNDLDQDNRNSELKQHQQNEQQQQIQLQNKDLNSNLQSGKQQNQQQNYQSKDRGSVFSDQDINDWSNNIGVINNNNENDSFSDSESSQESFSRSQINSNEIKLFEGSSNNNKRNQSYQQNDQQQGQESQLSSSQISPRKRIRKMLEKDSELKQILYENDENNNK